MSAVTRCEKCNKLFSTKIEEFKVYCEYCEKKMLKEISSQYLDKDSKEKADEYFKNANTVFNHLENKINELKS